MKQFLALLFALLFSVSQARAYEINLEEPIIAAVPTITGFNTRADGYTVTASVWNTELGGIYSYINTNLVGTLNLLDAKGELLTHDGTSHVALPNAGSADNNKVLTFDSTQTAGMKWASVASVATLTTKGDLLGYSTANARVPVGTNGQVLTADSAEALGLKWATPTTAIPTGVIAMWSGSIASIPSGWALCDGQSGRPNLQGLFVVGAGNVSPAATDGMGLLSPGTVGGDASAGAGLGPSHSHVINVAAVGFTVGPTLGLPTTPTGTATVTPKYYALAFIIKL